ncbi:response regulator [Neptuniibacter sp. 1_MG-2023]|uniref:response regulator n=1 Tax=Neptuniibacter sp. 1_MG-2023 TaxID=3062662 RepID=UPI0026E38718|nr:response regulator [Neptuniibacter sp. 1_MG-2023]MDO6593172.1 response regulator [Neptuniibacter sp. 1_MG-2023]
MSQIKVLIVDDARFIRDHVSRIVKEHFPEYQIDSAEDGEAGRKQMNNENYDLILCDWEMPGMSGLDLLQWARQQVNYVDIPFIMITSRGERDYVLKAIQAGVNDYMGKPFEDRQLVEKIKKYVGKRFTTSAESRRKAAQMLAAGKTAAVAKAAKKPKGLAQLRVASGVLRCAIKEVTLQSVQVVVKREDGVPQLLEQSVVDIEQVNGNSVAQMNGFISGLQANEKSTQTNFISVDIQFVDNDPEKLEVLTHYIASLTKQSD